MVFSSLTFIFIFLPIVLFLLALCRKTHYQNTLLFLSSLLFYSWGGISYTLILLCSLVLNFFLGRRIERAIKSKVWLTIGILLNLSSLIVFKYTNFLVENGNILLHAIGLPTISIVKIVLPIGISFYTFQAISYLVDVYRKQVQAQTNFIKLGTYIALFPQLIAGPIIRYNEIETQLTTRSYTLNNIYDGTLRFCFGLARKILIANQLARIVDTIFSQSTETLTPVTAWFGAICYALQIYYDFAGYSDMAIGLGRIFGFRFPENFNLPYTARSIREFWRRWHITLSAWFKDYLYIPLGGNRGTKWQTYRNLFVVFLLTGLWHGANWTFLIWGLLHGLFIILERVGFDRLLEKSIRPLQHIYTLLVVVLAWVFFRADSLSQALCFIQHMFGIHAPSNGNQILLQYMQPSYLMVLFIALLGCTPIFQNLNEHCTTAIHNGHTGLLHARQITILFGIIFVLLSTCCFLVVGGYNPFIYFRF